MTVPFLDAITTATAGDKAFAASIVGSVVQLVGLIGLRGRVRKLESIVAPLVLMAIKPQTSDQRALVKAALEVVSNDAHKET